MPNVERLVNIAVFRIFGCYVVVEAPNSEPRALWCGCSLWSDYRCCYHAGMAEASCRVLMAARGARAEGG